MTILKFFAGTLEEFDLQTRLGDFLIFPRRSTENRSTFILLLESRLNGWLWLSTRRRCSDLLLRFLFWHLDNSNYYYYYYRMKMAQQSKSWNYRQIWNSMLLHRLMPDLTPNMFPWTNTKSSLPLYRVMSVVDDHRYKKDLQFFPTHAWGNYTDRAYLWNDLVLPTNYVLVQNLVLVSICCLSPVVPPIRLEIEILK